MTTKLEDIARVIDPGAWRHEDNYSDYGVAEHQRRKGRRATATNRARSVLSLLPSQGVNESAAKYIDALEGRISNYDAGQLTSEREDYQRSLSASPLPPAQSNVAEDAVEDGLVFENFPALAKYIERLAHAPLGWPSTDWCAFLDELNRSLNAAALRRAYVAGQEGTSVLLGRAADALRTNQKDSALAAELLAYSIICENGNYPALALQCQAAAGALT